MFKKLTFFPCLSRRGIYHSNVIFKHIENCVYMCAREYMAQVLVIYTRTTHAYAYV